MIFCFGTEFGIYGLFMIGPASFVATRALITEPPLMLKTFLVRGSIKKA